MDQIIVEASPRESRGKNAARRLRVAGTVPGSPERRQAVRPPEPRVVNGDDTARDGDLRHGPCLAAGGADVAEVHDAGAVLLVRRSEHVAVGAGLGLAADGGPELSPQDRQPLQHGGQRRAQRQPRERQH